MKFYLAPMEGLTGFVFRQAYRRYFGDADRYFTPFLTGMKLSSRGKNDVLPEHNEGTDLVPQILSNRAEEFIRLTDRLYEDYGYEEVNLNLGCPSPTVAAKNRGAGFLRALGPLDAFLDRIYRKCKVRISIKTRIGAETADDWGELIRIYNQYPVSELIVHPRLRVQGYGGTPDQDAFALAVSCAKMPLCYNGDIDSAQDYERMTARFPTVGRVMCGRGILKNPALFGILKGKQSAQTTAPKETLLKFHDAVYSGYKETMAGERNVLFRMKELWNYFCICFPQPEQCVRAVRKAESYLAYEAAVHSAFWTI